MPTVLVIDDNPSVATALEVLLSLQDINTLRALSPDEGLALLDGNDVDLVVQDMNFSADTTSGEEGVALFGEIRKRHPDLPVILLTAWTHLDAAVDLIKAGAADYLAKPWDDRKLATMNRPGFRRHLQAILFGNDGGVYEQQSLHGRVQGGSGQADHRTRAFGGRCGGSAGGFDSQPLCVAKEAGEANCGAPSRYRSGRGAAAG